MKFISELDFALKVFFNKSRNVKSINIFFFQLKRKITFITIAKKEKKEKERKVKKQY